MFRTVQIFAHQTIRFSSKIWTIIGLYVIAWFLIGDIIAARNTYVQIVFEHLAVHAISACTFNRYER